MAARFWPVRLEHGPVTLRPLRAGDESDWARIRGSDPQWFAPWDSTRPPGSLGSPQTFKALARTMARRARRGEALPWAIEYHDAKAARFVGQLTVAPITGGSVESAQMGYWIDPAWAGRGIMPIAVALATDHCFQVRRLHRVEIAIRTENTKSLAVVGKLGFRHEGRRDRYLHVAGDWRDHEIFVLTAEEVPQGVLARYETSRLGPIRG